MKGAAHKTPNECVSSESLKWSGQIPGYKDQLQEQSKHGSMPVQPPTLHFGHCPYISSFGPIFVVTLAPSSCMCHLKSCPIRQEGSPCVAYNRYPPPQWCHLRPLETHDSGLWKTVKRMFGIHISSNATENLHVTDLPVFQSRRCSAEASRTLIVSKDFQDMYWYTY